MKTDPDLAEHETEMAAWRDRIKIHPATDLFPMLLDEELSALSKDIDQNGLVTPLTFFCSMSIADEGLGRTDFGTVLDWANKNNMRRRVDMFLIDGRNRLAAIERIEDPARRSDLLHDALAFDGHASLRFAEELRDPLGFVASANLHRRHLSAEQKRDLVAKLLHADPGRSDRAIAKLTSVSHPTVGQIRREMEKIGDVEKVSTRTDAAGRLQPAAKPIRHPSPATALPVAASPLPRARHTREPWATSPTQRRDRTIVALSRLLHRKPADTLQDLVRLLEDVSARIGDIPREKRLALASGYLRALRLHPDDLRPVG